MRYTEIDGKRDCQNGVKHALGKGEAYDLGYGEQHQREQIATAKTIEAPKIEEFFTGGPLDEFFKRKAQ